MKIRVLQRHIDKAWKNRNGVCPIALAVREQAGYKRAKAGIFYVYLRGFNNHRGAYKLPSRASNFSHAQFVGYRPRKPFSFFIDDLMPSRHKRKP